MPGFSYESNISYEKAYQEKKNSIKLFVQIAMPHKKFHKDHIGLNIKKDDYNYSTIIIIRTVSTKVRNGDSRKH